MFDKKNLKLPENQGESRQSLNVLRECGYHEGVLQLLVTDKDTGIVGDRLDVTRRQRLFGRNKIALPQSTPFHELLATQYEDENVVFLVVAATFYLVFSLLSGNASTYAETLTIYAGVFFASLIAAFCDWIKERQFLKIKDEINNAEVLVFRGGHGNVHSISVRELVVGDIIDIEQGDRVPADCLLIEEANIAVDQSMYNPKDTWVEKSLSLKTAKAVSYGEDPDNHKENPDPFLLSASKIMSGSGKAVVCAVGRATRLARTSQQQDLVVKEQNTYLEQKLDELAKQIQQYATLVTVLVVITMGIYTLMLIVFNDKREFLSIETLLSLAKVVILAVCILIVAIPEGLPLAVSIAMALSINKLKNDQILIKNMEAVQTAAMIHDICIGKTGTITTGDMRVRRVQLFNDYEAQEIDDDDATPFFGKGNKLHKDLKNLVIESILCNNDCRLEANDVTLSYDVKGTSPVEVTLTRFLMDNGHDVQ